MPDFVGRALDYMAELSDNCLIIKNKDEGKNYEFLVGLLEKKIDFLYGFGIGPKFMKSYSSPEFQDQAYRAIMVWDLLHACSLSLGERKSLEAFLGDIKRLERIIDLTSSSR